MHEKGDNPLSLTLNFYFCTLNLDLTQCTIILQVFYWFYATHDYFNPISVQYKKQNYTITKLPRFVFSEFFSRSKLISFPWILMHAKHNLISVNKTQTLMVWWFTRYCTVIGFNRQSCCYNKTTYCIHMYQLYCCCWSRSLFFFCYWRTTPTDVLLAILRCVYNFQKCMKR